MFQHGTTGQQTEPKQHCDSADVHPKAASDQYIAVATLRHKNFIFAK